MADAQFRCRHFKQSGKILFAVREAVGELKTVVRLDTLRPDTLSSIPPYQLFQEISGGIRGLLWISSQKTQTGKLVNGRVLKQAKLRVRDTVSWNDFHIHLDSLSGVGHLLIRLGFVRILCFLRRKHPQFLHNPI